MDAITFTKQSDGWYSGSFTAAEAKTVVQIERTFVAGDNSLVVLASMDSLPPAVYKRYEGACDANMLLNVVLPEDTVVTIRSKTEVLKAYHS